MVKLFGTDGVRGVFNEDLDPEKALKIGMAIATYLPYRAKVLVGRDLRGGSYTIYSAVIAGLMSSGADVYEAGEVPTPALELSVRDGGFDAGVMVTASHNPPEYVGIKLVTKEGFEAPRWVEEEIEKIYFDLSFRRVSWSKVSEISRSYTGVIEHYINSIVDQVDVEKIRSKRYRVVVDPVNSVTYKTTPQILRRLGAKVLTINSDPSRFPSRNYEPTPENLDDLSTAVKAFNADLGVAHDGDGDRAIFADSSGKVIWGDRTAVIIAIHIAKNRKHDKGDRVVTAVSSPPYIEDILEEYGIKVSWVRVGAPSIAQEMLKGDALCGFEENGGFIYPRHLLVRDGGMKLALMLEALSYENASLDKLLAIFPKVETVKTKIRIKDRDRAQKLISELVDRFANYQVMTIDGVKIISDEFWILVRLSGTEPVVRIMMEYKDKNIGEKILNDLRNMFMGV